MFSRIWQLIFAGPGEKVCAFPRSSVIKRRGKG